ncbi:MAG: phosphate transport system regulatory protein PhoU, partial [Aliifodinibius sp.]|nr:phosphate transport system regulatory protein PhoU [Fodinibius sp.]NIV10083.1 phosphate transport system regulatory protein PhoU [Fodinibius sp.]NIY23683.1 phosphate transport system regulatory protein PhoU [Fodinibius sp.]
MDIKIKELLDDVIMLGSMVEQMTLDAIQALKKYDLPAARRTYKYDEKVNKMRFQIEERTMTLIATQAPVARDMRLLASIMEIATEL